MDIKAKIRENICNNLKELRQKHNYTQADVGEIVGKAATTIASWERGDSTPDVATLYILSKTYNVNLDEICTTLSPFTFEKFV